MLSYNLVVIRTALFKLKLSDSIRFWTCYIYVKLNFRMWMGSLGLYKYFPIWWLRKEYVEKYKKYTQTATIQIDQNHWKSDSYEKKNIILASSTCLRTRRKLRPASFLRSSVLHVSVASSAVNRAGYVDTSSNPLGTLTKKNITLI